jgi:ABC-type multidrug transport system permease subunit
MSHLRVALAKDFRRLLKDPAAILLSVAIPVFVGILLSFIAGGSGASPTAKLLVADHDDSLVSRLLAGGFAQGPLEDLVQVDEVTEEEGRALLNEGKASGLLVIPEGFGEAVLLNERSTLHLLTNPSQRILPGILEGALGLMVDAVNSLQTLTRPTVEPLLAEILEASDFPSSQQVAALSAAVNELVKRAEPYLFPPVIEVKTVFLEETKDEEFNFAAIFFPSLFFMSMIFTAQNLSDDLWKERRAGTLRRTLVSPVPMGTVLLAKLLAATLVFAAVAAAGLVIARWVIGIPFSNIPLGVVWGVLSGQFMLLFFTALQLLAGSQRGGNLLTSGILFPLVMVGGAFFPFEAMPDWLVRIGRLTPNGWALMRFKEILGGAAQAPLLLYTLAGLLLVGAAFFAFSLLRLRSFARAA